MWKITLIVALVLLVDVSSFQHKSPILSTTRRVHLALADRAVFYRNQNRLSARVARNEDKVEQTTEGGGVEPDDGMMTIPDRGFSGETIL